MSETATPTPTAAPESSVSAPDTMSFADAFDAGFEALDKAPAVETSAPTATAVTAPAKEVKSEPIAKNDNSANTNPLDIFTKRLTGQEEVTKSETVADDLDVKAPENLKPEAQTAWARLTKDLREARTKLKELESKVSEAPTNSVEQIDLQNQLNTLKQERDEYENELKFSRLESTKEYKTAVTQPLNAIQKEVSEISKLYEGVDPRNIYAAMVEPDPAKRRALLKEATSAFDPVDALAVRSKAEELQKVFERREVLTKDVNTVLQMIQAEEEKEATAFKQRMESEVKTAYESEWENLQKENALLRPIEGNEAWNNTLSNIQQQALQIENTELDARSKAKLTFNAAAMPVVMNVFQDYVAKSQARITELEKLTKELRSTLPSSGAAKGGGVEVPSDLGFVEALERGLKQR
jgi:hypothetical protein